MKVNELCEIINEMAPFDTACAWDNCGLILGDENQEIKGVYLTLDADMYALEKAKENGCNVVVSHHPVIFGSVSKITAKDVPYHYITSGISVISAHTCLDMAKGGVNDCLAQVCSLENIEDFMLEGAPLGRIGTCEGIDGYEFAERIKKNMGIDHCDCIVNRPVNRVCVVSGSGGSAINDAYLAGCDTLVTGEAKHECFVTAHNLSMNIFVLGHFESENIVLKPLYDLISKKAPCFISNRKQLVERR